MEFWKTRLYIDKMKPMLRIFFLGICLLFSAFLLELQAQPPDCDGNIYVEANKFAPCGTVGLRDSQQIVFDWANLLAPDSVEDIKRIVKETGLPAAQTAVVTLPNFKYYMSQNQKGKNLLSFPDFATFYFVYAHFAKKPSSLLILFDQASGKVEIRGDKKSLKGLEAEIAEIKAQLLEGNNKNARPPPSRQILVRTNSAIQDFAGLFPTLLRTEISQYEGLIMEQNLNVNQFKLVTIKDFHAFRTNPNTPAKTFSAFVDRMFDDWGLDKIDKSILIVHQTEDSKLKLRLGNGFSPDARMVIQNIFSKYYAPQVIHQATGHTHVNALRSFFEALPEGLLLGKLVPAAATPQYIKKITPLGPKVRDYAGIFTTEELSKLNDLVIERKIYAKSIWFITVSDYKKFTNSSLSGRAAKSFSEFANYVDGDFRIRRNLYNFLILYDENLNQVQIRTGYDIDDTNTLVLQRRYNEFLKYPPVGQAHLKAMTDFIDPSHVPGENSLPPDETPSSEVQTENQSNPLLNILIGAVALIVISIAIIRMIRFALVNRPPRENRQRKARLSAWKTARGDKLGKSIFVPKPVKKDGEIACPRCGGPVNITQKAARGYFANAHTHRSCTRCSWFSVAVPRKKQAP